MAILLEKRQQQQAQASGSVKVCTFWLQSRCLKGSSCAFAHTAAADRNPNSLPSPNPNPNLSSSSSRSGSRLQIPDAVDRTKNNVAAADSNKAGRVVSLKRSWDGQDFQIEKAVKVGGALQRVCKYWQDGRCKFGDQCMYVHPTTEENEARHAAPFEDPARCFVNQSGLAETIKPAAQVLPAKGLKRSSLAETKVPVARVFPGECSKGASQSDTKTKKVFTAKKNEQKTVNRQVKKEETKAVGSIPGLELLTTLKAHDQSVTGIALVVDAALLFTGGCDETVKAWNCQSGQFVDSFQAGGTVKSIVAAFGWVFVAVGNEVKAWNPKLATKDVLSGAAADITVLATGNGCVIAGTSQGTICGWNVQNDGKQFSTATSFAASPAAVSSLKLVGGWIYAGFSDGSISLWDLSQLKLLHAATHRSSSAVTGITVCSGSSLLSSSDDGLVRHWSADSLQSGPENEKFGGGVKVFQSVDAQGKPVLGCLYRDSRLRMFDLPSLNERGSLFLGGKVTSVVSSSETGLVFVGDNEGAVKVWRWIQN